MADKNPPSDRIQALADAFKALTYREMVTLAEVFSDTLQATNGLCVKATVFAEVLDSFGAYIEIDGSN